MHFKPQIQESLPDEKAAKEFYERKDFNKLIVSSMKQMEHLFTRFLCLQLSEIETLTTALRRYANSLPAGKEKLELMHLNILILNQIEQDLKP